MPLWVPSTQAVLDHNGIHSYEQYFGMPFHSRGGFSGRGGPGHIGMMNAMTGMAVGGIGHHPFAGRGGFRGRGRKAFGHMGIMNPTMGMDMPGGLAGRGASGGFGNPMMGMGMMGSRGGFGSLTMGMGMPRGGMPGFGRGGFPGQPQTEGSQQSTIGGLGAGTGSAGLPMGGQQLGPGGVQ